jgi:hypothetical protein
VTHEQKKTEERGDLLVRAMACPRCGLLCAIVEIGLVCPSGCGGIRPFASVWEFLQQNDCRSVSLQGVKPLLRKKFPAQIVQPRRQSEIAPPYGG